MDGARGWRSQGGNSWHVDGGWCAGLLEAVAGSIVGRRHIDIGSGRGALGGKIQQAPSEEIVDLSG